MPSMPCTSIHASGAESIGLHMVSPISKGLFQRVILQSGAPLMNYEYQTRQTEGLSRELVKSICVGDVTETSRLFECLQNVPSSHILVSTSTCVNSFSIVSNGHRRNINLKTGKV